LESDVALLADQLIGRGLNVVSVLGEATGPRVRGIIADLRDRAASGETADLLVLYAAGHGSPTATGSLEFVLSDGARLDVEEFAAAFGTAERAVVIFDIEGDKIPVGALVRAAAAEYGSSGHSIALLWCTAPGPGSFTEALVAALARTGIVDDTLLGTVNERLAAGTGGQDAARWAYLSSSGSPISWPELEAIPVSSNDLAGKLRVRGDLAGARDLYQSTYDAQRRMLGADHVDTLTSANRLAGVMRALGDHQAARELDEGNEVLRRHLQDEAGPR
jgi:hypothetical protein